MSNNKKRLFVFIYPYHSNGSSHEINSQEELENLLQQFDQPGQLYFSNGIPVERNFELIRDGDELWYHLDSNANEQIHTPENISM